MSHPFTDRDLLYGVLAVQMGFVDRQQLMAAIKDRQTGEFDSLGAVLLSQQAIEEGSKQSLDQLVDDHVALHSNNAAQSLATLSGVDSLENELRTLGFPDLDATLAHLPPTMALSSEKSVQNYKLAEVNRFRVLHMHAKGGIGQVSVAVDQELSREVALKELQTRFADDQDTRARFVLEAEITGGLEHPGVVPVYGLGHHADGRPYYAMRFVRGDSLQDATEQFHQRFAQDSTQPGFDLELRKLLQRFIAVCDAMEYAHSRGVLHRDLKPANIMIGNYGETLVVDWGLAKVGNEPSQHISPADESKLYPASASDSAPTQLGSTVGTPQYMSPEQAGGRINELDATSDVYSLGATLYHILTGSPPFEGSDIGVVLAAVQSGIFSPPRAVNPRVSKPQDAICLKAMALEPEDRYTSARALAEDVERSLADESIKAMPDSGLQRVQRWTRRHRGLTLASAIGLLLLSVVSAFSYFAVSTQRDEARRQRDRAITSEAAAQESFLVAEKARAIAVEQERLAARIAYSSTVSQASALVGSDPMMARFLLEDEVRCPPIHRDFVWRCLMRQLVREELSIPLVNAKAHVLSYSPDGKLIATGGGLSGTVVLRLAQTGKQIATWETGLKAVDRLVFSKDGRALAAEHEQYDGTVQQVPKVLAEIRIWDVIERKLRQSRQLTVPQKHLLCAAEGGFFVHSFAAEAEYAAEHPDYAQKYRQPANEFGRLIDRWHRWTSYDIQSGAEVIKYFIVGEQVDLAEGFYVHGKWLTTPCHTADGEFLWMYDLEREIGKTIRVGQSGVDKSSLMVGSNNNAAFFLDMHYVDESVSEIDSLAYLDTIEFDTDLSFQRLLPDGPSTQLARAVGRVHSGVFVEDQRNQFVATDRDGTVLATAMEPRPVIQVVDFRHDGATYWLPAHRGDVVSISVSPNGSQLATLGLDRTLRLWSVPKFAAQGDFTTTMVERPRRLLLSPDGSEVVVLALGPDSSANGIDYSQPLPPGETEYPTPLFFQAESLRLTDGVSIGTHDYIDPPRYGPSQSKSALGIFGSFSEGLGNAVAGSFAVNPIQDELTEAKLTPDGSELILAGPDRLLRCNLQTGQAAELWGEFYPNLKEPQQILRITVSDDLKFYVTMLEQDRSLHLYDLASQKLLRELQVELDLTAAEIKFVPGGHTLMVTYEGDAPEESSAHSQIELINIDDDTRRSLQLPLLDSDSPMDLSTDGKWLIVFQQYDREVLVYELASGELVSRANVVRETPGGMLPNSDLLMLFGDSGELKLWDIRLNQYQATLQLLDGEVISKAVLSRDGNNLVVLGEQGSLRFYGADQLLDDFADIHKLMHEPLIPTPTSADSEVAQLATIDPEQFPSVEILDVMPTPAATSRPFAASDEGTLLPPAPLPVPPSSLPE